MMQTEQIDEIFRTYNFENLIVTINKLGSLKDYKFSVIFSHYQNKWLYARKKGRDTFEVPGGTIEEGETILECARRELYEESGALKYEIRPMFDYSFARASHMSNGQVFLAEIKEIGKLPDFEMEEVILTDGLPEKLTYPEGQGTLYKTMMAILEGGK